MADQSNETPAVVTPYLLYEDVKGALGFLAKAFGFHEREIETMTGPSGNVVHSAMEIDGGGAIMLGCPGADYKNPKRLGQATQQLYVYVDDAKKHFEQAKQAGAKILAELEETFYGDLRYGVEDLEGHAWYFAQKIRDVAPEDWKPTDADLEGHG